MSYDPLIAQPFGDGCYFWLGRSGSNFINLVTSEMLGNSGVSTNDPTYDYPENEEIPVHNNTNRSGAFINSYLGFDGSFDFTITFLVKNPNIESQYNAELVISNTNRYDGAGFLGVSYEKDTQTFEIGSATYGGLVFSSSDGIDINDWLKVVITYNASTSLLTGIVNLVEKTQNHGSYGSHNMGIFDTSWNTGSFQMSLAGSLADVRFYDRILTAGEIQTYYATSQEYDDLLDGGFLFAEALTDFLKVSHGVVSDQALTDDLYDRTDFKPIVDDAQSLADEVFIKTITRASLTEILNANDLETLRFLKQFGELILTNLWQIKEVDQQDATGIVDLEYFIAPADVNLTIYQGATFEQTFSFTKTLDGKPYNIQGWQARMQIRRKKKEDTVDLELTSENGGLTLEVSDTASSYTIYISPEQTALLSSGGVYDIELIDFENEVLRIQQGSIILSTEVTK